jgi:hypothetical protein
MCVCVVAVQVKALWLREVVLVVVRGAKDHQHVLLGGDADTAQHGVRGGGPDERRDRGLDPEHLLERGRDGHRGRHEFGPARRLAQQMVERVANEVGDRLMTGEETRPIIWCTSSGSLKSASPPPAMSVLVMSSPGCSRFLAMCSRMKCWYATTLCATATCRSGGMTDDINARKSCPQRLRSSMWRSSISQRRAMTRSGSGNTSAEITSAHPWGARTSRRDCVIVRIWGSSACILAPEKARLMTRRKRLCSGGSVLMIKGTGGTPVRKTASASGHNASILLIESCDEKRLGSLRTACTSS